MYFHHRVYLSSFLSFVSVCPTEATITVHAYLSPFHNTSAKLMKSPLLLETTVAHIGISKAIKLPWYARDRCPWEWKLATPAATTSVLQTLPRQDRGTWVSTGCRSIPSGLNKNALLPGMEQVCSRSQWTVGSSVILLHDPNSQHLRETQNVSRTSQ